MTIHDDKQTRLDAIIRSYDRATGALKQCRKYMSIAREQLMYAQEDRDDRSEYAFELHMSCANCREALRWYARFQKQAERFKKASGFAYLSCDNCIHDCNEAVSDIECCNMCHKHCNFEAEDESMAENMLRYEINYLKEGN